MPERRTPTLHRGARGSVSAAHPLAVAAGEQMLHAGGSAADAAIAAQAMLCVIMPDACGLGGDMLALLHRPGHAPLAFNGAGAAPAALSGATNDGATSITVPGLVDAWCQLSLHAGRLPLSAVLAPAIALARSGATVSTILAAALQTQRSRLLAGGAQSWPLFDQRAGAMPAQPELAALLERIGAQGSAAFYAGAAAEALIRQVRALGGAMSVADLAAHSTIVDAPVASDWDGWRIATQPPMSQGILLNMAIEALQRLPPLTSTQREHAAIELTEAAFAYRDEVARGHELLTEPLSIDLQRAAGRGGPRAYLHTAGVAAADADGMVVSSLVSVFDDFGSCVYVPELGLVLNNRAGGFTAGRNAAAAGKRPVHTLAPMLLSTPRGTLALATPGADGQVQTLLQVLVSLKLAGASLPEAIARPRWRSENGRLLIEAAHPDGAALAALGHRLAPLPDGDLRFGAVVCAGLWDSEVVATSDWRRECAAGAI